MTKRCDFFLLGTTGRETRAPTSGVAEMVRQIRQILGADRVEISVVTQNPDLTRGYFPDTGTAVLPDIFPPFLAREIPKFHGVVACEGSMFKSRFADALTTLMIGALGIASARNGISIGFGAEAGDMTKSLQWMTRRYCQDSLVLTRNRESETILRRLGVPTEPGTDTAWTFVPHPPEFGEKKLREAGWDGVQPILALCPIHPFWWPVKSSLPKTASRLLFGRHRESHYRSIYFHKSGPQVDQSFENYLEAFATATRAFGERHSVFPILVAMERLDTRACDRVADKLSSSANLQVPVFSSNDFDMFELVSILRHARWMISSRFHAIVTSMPAGVVSAGVTMDERIHNLMTDRRHTSLLHRVDEAQLTERLLETLEEMHRDHDVLQSEIRQCVGRQLHGMARMGYFFEQEVTRHVPEFSRSDRAVPYTSYLPPLTEQLREIAEEAEDAVPAALRPDETGAPREQEATR